MHDAAIDRAWERHVAESRKYLRAEELAQDISSQFAKFLQPHLANVVESDGATLLTVDHLTTEALHGLFVSHEYCAIRIPGFCSRKIADRVADKALQEFHQWFLYSSGGQKATDMFYAGGSIPCNVAAENKELFVQYCEGREEYMRSQRALCDGNWPVDRMRIEADEAWPLGAKIGLFGPGKARPAMLRAMVEGGVKDAPERGFIHIDDAFFLRKTAGTGSINIYLRIPDVGGELLVWPVNVWRGAHGLRERLRHAAIAGFLANAFTIEFQAPLESLLPPPVCIRPEPGDLVMIHSGRPHSVVTPKGPRASWQSFVQYNGTGEPLTITS